MDSASPITVIVPRLPPSVDGLGDYGLALALQLRQDYKINSKFIVGDHQWSGSQSVEGFSVTQVKSREEQELLDLLPQASDGRVLLHYVGYGYARRGSPVWLVNALEEWKRRGPKRKLIIMMHEIYAFGPIWTSQFWTSWLQRNLAARLVRLSDSCLTSKKQYAEIMGRYSGGKHSNILSIPVFSNIGELTQTRTLRERKSRLVVFGSKGPRERVYHHAKLALEKVCQQLAIEEIWDIGSPLNFQLPRISGKEIKVMGILPSAEISKILSESQVGFFNYPTAYLSKSGIFAAYSSHGVLPAGVYWEDQTIDGVEAGIHYVIPKQSSSFDLDKAQVVASNAFHWYQEHSLQKQAQIFSHFLLN